MRDPLGYAKKVENYVERYATPQNADEAAGGDDEDDEEEELVPRSKRPEKATSTAGATGNGSATNGNGTSTNGQAVNGNSKADDDEEDDDDDEDDKMSDMGELSDGDEFMGEMDD